MKTFLAIAAMGLNQLVAAQQTQRIPSFSNLAVSGNIEVALVKSAENKLVMQKGSLENLKVTSGKKGLGLSLTKSGEELEVVLYYSHALEEIAVPQSAEVNAKETIVAASLKVSAASGSEVNIDAEAGELGIAAASDAEVTLSGKARLIKAAIASGAELNAKHLKSEKVEATLASDGEAAVYASKSVTATVASGGRLDIYGNPGDISKTVSNGGTVNIIK